MPQASSSHGKPLDVGTIGLTAADLPSWEQGYIDPGAWFAEDRRALPLELEIGSGKGTFILNQSGLEPQTNFLGIEYAKAFWRLAADRCRRHGRINVRLIYAEAAFLVRNYFPDKAFQKIHIYFPDPWPKARHHKRRLVQEPFLRELHRILAPLGLILLATDHADYFAWMQLHAGHVAHLFAEEPFTKPASAAEGELVGSNFERKYRIEGRTFNAMALRRRPALLGE